MREIILKKLKYTQFVTSFHIPHSYPLKYFLLTLIWDLFKITKLIIIKSQNNNRISKYITLSPRL